MVLNYIKNTAPFCTFSSPFTKRALYSNVWYSLQLNLVCRVRDLQMYVDAWTHLCAHVNEYLCVHLYSHIKVSWMCVKCMSWSCSAHPTTPPLIFLECYKQCWKQQWEFQFALVANPLLQITGSLLNRKNKVTPNCKSALRRQKRKRV